jgi:hypothetical protein
LQVHCQFYCYTAVLDAPVASDPNVWTGGHEMCTRVDLGSHLQVLNLKYFACGFFSDFFLLPNVYTLLQCNGPKKILLWDLLAIINNLGPPVANASFSGFYTYRDQLGKKKAPYHASLFEVWTILLAKRCGYALALPSKQVFRKASTRSSFHTYIFQKNLMMLL